MTGNQHSNLGFEVCCSLSKKTNQVWMVERLVGNINDFMFKGYELIRNSKESFLVFVTPDDDEQISNKKMGYLFSVCEVFKKRVLTFSINMEEKDLNSSLIEHYGGHVIKCSHYPDVNMISDGIIDLHCGGEKWRTRK
jgi:hypothetical protein